MRKLIDTYVDLLVDDGMLIRDGEILRLPEDQR